jgi:hypothetical protein
MGNFNLRPIIVISLDIWANIVYSEHLLSESLYDAHNNNTICQDDAIDSCRVL